MHNPPIERRQRDRGVYACPTCLVATVARIAVNCLLRMLAPRDPPPGTTPPLSRCPPFNNRRPTADDGNATPRPGMDARPMHGPTDAAAGGP